MAGTHTLTRTEARRIAVRAQLLDADRPADLLDTVRRLTLLQSDATDAVAPSADLVAWSRLGRSYRPEQLAAALRDGSLIELRGMIRPGEDIALYRAEMAQWPGEASGWRQANDDWVRVNDDFRQDILERLDNEGPLTSRELPDSCLVPWRSSGWNNSRNASMMLELLEQRGEVAVAGRRGRDRLWDLASRVYPDNDVVPLAEALRIRDQRRLRSLGIVRAKTAQTMIEPLDVGETGEPAVVEGVRGRWRVDPELLGQPFRGRVAVLSPLDRLVYDRKRMVDLFEFDYQLEMYKPAAQRRWGYYALPILYGDRLVGKVDATSHRGAGVLQVDAIHQDVPFSRALASAVRRELTDLARCLDLDIALPG
ncbi:DNA glycosylase AlkZ-like family protein [Jatrophihabitans sp.]|uniref:DNA glycosylase AlkZ-like family protein n=1 Tax=Jatrophihabitans sp. TaxID=1932789 RepID=UPI002CF1192F|nr:crosslink repair DNA glycosylase YcaQ family protein [Jatrophihabitans sp.]